MIRGLALTDAPAYVSFRKTAPINEAIVGPKGKISRLGLVDLLGRSALPDPRRSTWIQIERGQISGLVSIRNRLGADIWDIDHLVSVPTPDQAQTYTELLNYLVSTAYSEGVHRLFLRVRTDGIAEMTSRQVGFCRYATESIYQASPELLQTNDQFIRMRPRRPADHQPLFQLYCNAVPARVRQIEGMTLQEWRSTDGWRLYPVDWRVGLPAGRRDYLVDGEDMLGAWLQVESGATVLRMLVRPSWPVDLDALLGAAAQQARRRTHLVLPVRDYQESLKIALQNIGAELITEHALLSRSLAVRSMEPKVVHGRRKLASAREAGL